MNRRGFFGALAAMPVAMAHEPPHYPQWRNYTFTYAPVDKAKIIQKMQKALEGAASDPAFHRWTIFASRRQSNDPSPTRSPALHRGT